MSPAAAALMRPAGVARVLASLPAAVLADPAVALVPQVAVPVASVVPEDSAGRVVAAPVGAAAADADLGVARACFGDGSARAEPCRDHRSDVSLNSETCRMSGI